MSEGGGCSDLGVTGLYHDQTLAVILPINYTFLSFKRSAPDALPSESALMCTHSFV